VQVTLTATDATSGVAATYYQIDSTSGSYLTYSGTFSVSSTGSHTVYFYSVDKAGNKEALKSTSFAIQSLNLAGIQIDDNTLQRSMVRSLTLNFNTPISSASLSTLVTSLSLNRVSDNLSITLKGTLDTSGKVVTLTFTGTSSTAVGSTIIGGSLPDGRYTLNYGKTSLLTSAQLWRLYGDLYGTASVTSADVTAFNTAYGVNGTRKGLPGYNVYLDYYANGLINITDKQQFQSRVGLSI
jgi:hypothetical protein